MLNSKETLRKILLTIEEITEAECVSLFLFDNIVGMDVDEKKDHFSKGKNRILNNLDNNDPYYKLIKNIAENDINKYSILKYEVCSKEELWKIDHNIRPEKYIVFNLKKYNKEPRDLKPISTEGLNAFVARKKSYIILDHNELRNHESYCGLNEKNNIYPKCEHTAIIAIRSSNGDNVGVLRCDKYDQNAKAFNDSKIEIITRMLDFLYVHIKKARKEDDKLSYRKLYGGDRILDSLRKASEKINSISDEENNINKEVLNKTQHLFYVLKRNAYVGQEDILNRIKGYIEDISDKLGLDSKFLIEQMDEFRKYENLVLYDFENYRDHFLHQFHVFVTGYIILNLVGVKHVLAILTNMKNMPKHLRNFKIKNLLRIWFITSFFHDFCYIVPYAEEKFAKFVSGILDMEFKTSLNWAQLLYKDNHFIANLNNMMEYTTKPDLNCCELVTNQCNLIIEKKDHGIISALVMLKKMKTANKDEDINEQMFDFEKYIASLAIAFHTEDSASKILIKNHEVERVSFNHYPILFLLVFSDTFQQWGRNHAKEEYQEYGNPVFFSIENIDKTIKANLLYDHKALGKQHKNVPPPEDLRKWSHYVKDKFIENEIPFQISYYAVDVDELNNVQLDEIGPHFELELYDAKKRRKHSRVKVDQTIRSGNSILYLIDLCKADNDIVSVGIGSSTNKQIGKELTLQINKNKHKFTIVRKAKTAMDSPFNYFYGCVNKDLARENEIR